jgi:hypothetical protein
VDLADNAAATAWQVLEIVPPGATEGTSGSAAGAPAD